MTSFIGDMDEAALVTDTTPGQPVIRHVNRAAIDLTGFPIKDLLNHGLRTLFGPDTDPLTVARIDQAIAQGEAVHAELALRHHNGGDLWADLRIVPVPNIEGGTGNFMVLLRDLSESRKSMQQKLVLERLLASVFAAVDHGLMILDEDGRFIAINKAFSQLSGWRDVDLLGRPYTELLVDPEGALTPRKAGRFESRFPLKLRRHDRTEIQIVAKSSIIRPEGSAHYHLIVVENAPAAERPFLASVSAPPGDIVPEQIGATQEFGRALASGALDPEDFAASAAARLAAQQEPRTLVAGSLKLIGLNDIRESLGARWDQVADQVRETATRIVESSLDPDDNFSLNGEDNFVICFYELTEQEAVIKAGAIAREIKATLARDLGLATEPRIAANASKISFSNADMQSGVNVLDMILGKLEEARKALEASYDDVIREAMENAEIEIGPVVTRAGERAPMVQAMLVRDVRAKLDEVRIARGEDEAMIAEIDLLLLGSTARHLYKTIATGKPPVFIVPLAFSTLAARRTGTKAITLCRSLSAAVRQHLIFDLVEVPADIAPMRMEEVVGQLKPFCRAVMLRPARPESRLVDFARQRLSMVSTRFSSIGTSDQELTRFGKFLENAHLHRCRVLVDAVPTMADAHHLGAIGVDLMAGPGVTGSQAPAQ
ncbi:MAG: PAS domain-containing protein [Azospirillaceae bacterium]|nr:PAS domain-containing protein [Azospirillaceae bacterium]